MPLCSRALILSWVKAKVKAYYTLKATIIEEMLSLQLGRMFNIFGKWSLAYEIRVRAGTLCRFELICSFDHFVWSRWLFSDGPIWRWLYFLHGLLIIASCSLFFLHVIFCYCRHSTDNKCVCRESLHKMYQPDIYIEMESVTERGYTSDSWCNCLKGKAQSHAPSGPQHRCLIS